MLYMSDNTRLYILVLERMARGVQLKVLFNRVNFIDAYMGLKHSNVAIIFMMYNSAMPF